LGPAEIGEDAVAEVLGDMSFEALDNRRDATMVGADHLAQVLGIERGRQRGRADQIDEHHRQLTALGFARNGRRRGLLSRLCPVQRRPGVQRRDRLEQPLTVAEVEPKLLQIGISQIAQDVARNAVLGERLGMMAKPLFSEPARDVEHFAPQAIA
jgi:hypothetical protein